METRLIFAILDELRASHPQMAVVMLTARGAEEDRVRGLKRGADDYVVKPFSATELLARVEAVLRRSAERPTGPARAEALRPYGAPAGAGTGDGTGPRRGADARESRRRRRAFPVGTADDPLAKHGAGR